ncbi:MAG: NTP transferase domain-containing protein [Candidatus Zixiibacteriota bacterium]
MKSPRAAIVLAAGQGKRMKSNLAKALHRLAGKPLIDHVISRLSDLGLSRFVVVVGHQGESVEKHLRKTFPELDLKIAWQKERRGTGHAVLMAREHVADFDGSVLVAACDVPCISPDSLKQLVELHEENGGGATCLSANFADPTGYGRVVRGENTDRLLRIVEQRDASEEIRRIKEISSGLFVFDSRRLFTALDQVTDDNTQGELYLTDVIGIMASQDIACYVSRVADPDEVRGVNSLDQLKELEAIFARS